MLYKTPLRSRLGRRLTVTIALAGLMSWSNLARYTQNLALPPGGSVPTNSSLVGNVRSDRAISTAEPVITRFPMKYSAARVRANEAYGRLPLSFEANHGQTNGKAAFISRGSGYNLFLTPTEAVLALSKPVEPRSVEQAPTAEDKVKARITRSIKAQAGERPQAVIRMQLRRANVAPLAAGEDELSGKVNYFIGNNPNHWITNIPTYAKVRYRQVYPGIDMVYYGLQGQLKRDFVVAPGADPSRITLGFRDVDRIEMNDAGDLVLHQDGEQVRQDKPLVYQEDGGIRHEIVSSYILGGRDEVRFAVGEYDLSKPLIIDPVLTYSTYLGGGNQDGGYSVAVDSFGNAYVTGVTVSTDFPTRNARQPGLRGTRSDAFVTKLNAAGTALIYSTYIGGSIGDIGHGIDVDGAGNAYVCGVTGGSTSFNDFPVANPLDSTYGGTDDAFLLQLNATGSALVFSTYLGGNNTDVAYEVAVDRASGDAYLSGYSASADFPTTPGAFKAVRGYGDPSDAFVAKFNAQGSVLYSTLLGGDFSGEAAYDIAIDAEGNAYVTGETVSSSFPVTAGAFQTACGGCNLFRSDAFVTKLNAQGSGLVYSTYLGGSIDDRGFGIAVDSAGSAYVTGQAESSNFPTTPGVLRPFGILNAFVTKLSPDGSALVYSTYLGGGVAEEGRSLAVDSAGQAHVTGKTRSRDFPVMEAVQSGFTIGAIECVFIATLNPAGTALVFSTYFGSGEGRHVVADGSGSIYVTGQTLGSLPTSTPVQPASPGGADAFLTRLTGFGAPMTSPGPATNLVATAMSADRIMLTWDDNSDNEAGFKIERCRGSACADFTQVGQTGANANSFTDAGLAAGSIYTYRVRAFNSGGDSAYSNEAAAATLNAVLAAAPGALTAQAVSSARIELRWTDNSGNETGFKVERCRGAGCTTFAEIARLGPNVTFYSDGKLYRNTTYQYRLCAYSTAGNSGYSNTASARTWRR